MSHIPTKHPACITGVILNLALNTSPVMAAAPRNLEISVSETSYQIGRLTNDDSGQKKSTNATAFYHLGLRCHLPVARDLMFSPMLRYMPESISSVESPDEGSRSTLLIAGLPLLVNIANFDIGGGLALMRYTVHGLGGVKTLNNGDQTTEFAQPGGTSTSSTIALQLGGGYTISRFRAGLDIFTQGLLSTEGKRSYSLMLSAGFNTFRW